MQINLFVCNAEKNRINKGNYLSGRFTMDGQLKKQTSALNIEITVQKENPLTYNYNYMYIPEFKRYYFIDDIINVHNNIWIIKGSVDVLYSFKNEILSTTAIIEKSELENNSNVYLDDGSFVMDTRKYNQIKEFPNGFNNNGEYILICAGGV